VRIGLGTEESMIIEDALREAEDKMRKAIEVAREEFGGVRTGRASPAFVNRLMVDYYGTPTQLRQLASFSVPEPRVLVVTPFDRSAMGSVEKAIRNSDLGINPSNDGVVIRLNFPPLTEERRKELIKVVHHRAEEARVGIRNIRRHEKERMEKAEKNGEISETDLRRGEKDLQTLTDRFIDEVGGMLEHKEHELLEV
jgi:ribosome recycling factor